MTRAWFWNEPDARAAVERTVRLACEQLAIRQALPEARDFLAALARADATFTEV